MRFLVIGAGALGTYIGGSLALYGEEVAFLERPEVAKGLTSQGIWLHLPQGEFHLDNLLISSDIDEILKQGKLDAILFALKSFDTKNALESLKPYCDVLPPIICLQNGVENETIIREVWGKDRVIAGTVTSAIGRNAPGDVVLEKFRGVGFAKGHPLSEELVKVFNRANLNARLVSREADMKWSKMLTNLLANASAAILDMPPVEIFNHGGLYRLEVRQIREALNVMQSMGVRSVNLPGTPIKLLTFIIQKMPPSLSQPLVKRAIGKGRGEKMPSFHIDLYSGRGKSEVSALNGAVVRFGEKHGVATPVNQFLNKTLQALTDGSLPLSTYRWQPARLLKDAPD